MMLFPQEKKTQKILEIKMNLAIAILKDWVQYKNMEINEIKTVYQFFSLKQLIQPQI